MSAEDVDDLDYECLHDLPLMDHIEWNHRITKEVASYGLNRAVSVGNECLKLMLIILLLLLTSLSLSGGVK
jgi:hypothetical protein